MGRGPASGVLVTQTRSARCWPWNVDPFCRLRRSMIEPRTKSRDPRRARRPASPDDRDARCSTATIIRIGLFDGSSNGRMTAPQQRMASAHPARGRLWLLKPTLSRWHLVGKGGGLFRRKAFVELLGEP